MQQQEEEHSPHRLTWFQLLQLARQQRQDAQRDQLKRASDPKLKLIDTLSGMQQQGHLILAVTLTPAICVSETTASSETFLSLWTSTLLHQVRRRLPTKHKYSHWMDAYAIELQKVRTGDEQILNPIMGLWHFHGFLVIHKSYRERFWKNGALHHAFQRDLASLYGKGKYHSLPIKSILVEILAADRTELLSHRQAWALNAIEQWANYASKPWCWKAKGF